MKKHITTNQEENSEESGREAQQEALEISTKKKLMRILSVQEKERISGKGRNALKAALDSGREIPKKQALDILGKLISDLRSFVAPKVNVHKPIKNQLETIEGVFEKLQKLEAQEQAKDQKTQSRTPKERRSPPLLDDPATDTNTEMDIETEVDTESAFQDSRKRGR
ncbi:hypothetical protein EVAR_35518_1 [Eumeta japonica]|uniref:Uncharacterized protein n=1 Tax=Eumeta variegata TaxID=151549 RepID=A0A4C1X8Q8_EUMVA|nr:hypothetical protein EVAR_35518_1 [Eumeta japonica]